MKIFLSLIFLLTMTKACAQDDLVYITYEASTRGGFYKTTVNKEQIAVMNSRNEAETKKAMCKATDWKELVAVIERIEVAKISSLTAPSTKHRHDGAWIASFSITVGDKTYTSTSFDHGNPPVELRKLYDQLMGMTENIDKQ